MNQLFLKDGKPSSDELTSFLFSGDLTHKCPIPNNVCGNNCNENSDCPANYSCCPNTCGNSCVKNIDLGKLTIHLLNNCI